MSPEERDAVREHLRVSRALGTQKADAQDAYIQERLHTMGLRELVDTGQALNGDSAGWPDRFDKEFVRACVQYQITAEITRRAKLYMEHEDLNAPDPPRDG